MPQEIQYKYVNNLNHCPNCGAKLTSQDIKCKYCDINLIGYNHKGTIKSTTKEYDTINQEKNLELRKAIATKRKLYDKYYGKMRKYKILDAILIPIAVIGLFYFWVLTSFG